MHVFMAQKWLGTSKESEEMRPEWFTLDNIPLDQMWDDTHYWLTHVLVGQSINAYFNFNEDNETAKSFFIQLL